MEQERPTLPPVTAIKGSNRHTKTFVFMALVYTLPVILTAVYCYARLDFVRSYDINTIKIEQN